MSLCDQLREMMHAYMLQVGGTILEWVNRFTYGPGIVVQDRRDQTRIHLYYTDDYTGQYRYITVLVNEDGEPEEL